MVYFIQVLNIVKGALALVMLSYFFGAIWYVICTLEPETLKSQENFIDHNGIKEDKIIIMTYYMTTTLATVGLGDYYPVSSWERIICSVAMLTGVAVFSIIF